MVATCGIARGSRLTASRVLELDDDKSDEPVDHEDQNEENDKGLEPSLWWSVWL